MKWKLKPTSQIPKHHNTTIPQHHKVMDELKYYDRIEAFVGGTMSADEQTRFEAELETNPELKTEYLAYRATHDVMEVLAFEQLQEELREMDIGSTPSSTATTSKEPPARIRRMPRRLLTLAASFLVLVLAGTLWWSNSQYSDQQLAGKHFMTPNLSKVRGTNTEDALSQAATAFYQGNYDTSIRLLQSIPSSDPVYADAQWLLGYACLQEGRAQEAVTAFNVVLSGNKNELKASARWHRILAHIAAGDQVAAEKLLDGLLQDPSDAYFDKARVLKKELHSFWRKWTW